MKFARLQIFSLLSLLYPLYSLDCLAASNEDILNLPIESLLNITVTSVSKRPQLLTNSASAIFVISSEDIRRSGSATIADALRMVPGVQVVRVDSSKWAVSARGMNSRFANKLLVLQDGRSLYTPLFSGVYWEVQDTPLEDIERIEVIRGPGAALWGANAVNGVINIITKSSEETKGGLVSAGGGTSETGFATIRYGSSLGENSFLRIYGKHNEYASGLTKTGDDAHDSWNMTRGGFRLDSNVSVRDTFTLQGDVYRGKLKETYHLFTLPTTTDPAYSHDTETKSAASGGNIISRWQRTLSTTDNLSLQLYYDHNERDMLVLPQKFDTVDLDFQHRFSWLDNQDLIWGAGFRLSRDQVTNTSTISFINEKDNHNLFTAFIHDELAVVPKKLSLILGSRFENNDYSGFEVQPNLRLIWTPTVQDTVWGAVSRSVRTPSRGEQDLSYHVLTSPHPVLGNALPIQIDYIGNRNFESEELYAYEIGYRLEPLPRISLDFAAYYNIYKKLRVVSLGQSGTEPVGSTSPTNAYQQLVVSNDMHGNSYGIEAALEWYPLLWWRIQTAYSYQDITMYLDGTYDDFTNKGAAEGSTPKQQFSLRNGFNAGTKVTFDCWLKGTGRIESINNQSIPGYVTMDARLAWKPYRNLELSLVGQNLFKAHHPEFNSDVVNTLSSEVPRSLYGKVTIKF